LKSEKKRKIRILEHCDVDICRFAEVTRSEKNTSPAS